MLKVTLNKEEFATFQKENEAVSKLYAQETDGSYRLQVEDSPLKSALQKERNVVTELKKQVTELQAQFDGIDPEAARAALLENGKKATKLSEIETKLQKVLDENKQKDTLNAVLTGQMSEMLVTTAATKAIADAKGSPELLLPIIQRNMRVRQADGKFIAEIIDGNGTVRLSPKAGSMEGMTIDELITELKTDTRYARAFDASGSSGSGSHGSAGGGSGGARIIDVSNIRTMPADGLEAIAKGNTIVR